MNRTPLRWRPLLPVLLSLASCAIHPTEPPSAVQLEGMRATTIVVAPFNVALPLPVELESSTSLVRRALLEHLERRGKKSQSVGIDIGKRLWIDSANEVHHSGGPRNFEAAARLFARKVRQRIEFDAIIIPSLYIQNASAGPTTARWDGANQRVEFIGRSREEIEMPSSTTIRAASLLVYVLDDEGSVIHTKQTGLELLQHMEISIKKKRGFDKRSWILEDDDPAIEDFVRVRAAVAHVLYPYLPK